MARIRSVHPGLWTDEAFVSVSLAARILSIGIWNECDDQGAFEWKPLGLKMKLMPADNVDVAFLLAELAEANIVAQYQVGGKNYGAVRNFGKYQRPKKPHSVYPMPEEWRKYAATDKASSKPENDDDGSGSDNGGDIPPSVPPEFPTASPPLTKKEEISPQMEDGGGRKEKEEKDSPSLREPPQRRKSRVDPGWRPNEAGVAKAKSCGISEISREVQRFVDYHAAKGNLMADWDAAWRTWCGNFLKFSGNPRPQPSASKLGWMLDDESAAPFTIDGYPERFDA